VLHMGVCNRLFDSWVLLKGSREIEITGPYTAIQTSDWYST